MSQSNGISYDKIADNWSDERHNALPDQFVISFVQRLARGSKVLDVGCGSGQPIDSYLVDQGLRVTGIDISQQLLEKARKNVPSATFKHIDINAYDSKQLFDGIVAWDSLFHLQLDEHAPVLRKLYGLLVPHGYLVFSHGGSEGEIESEMHGEKFTYSSLGPAKLKSTIVKLGFQIIDWTVDTNEAHGYMKALVQK